MKRIGVLLAAGRSGRMGRLKQLLPWPPHSPDAKPLVAAAFDAIAPVCDAMLVVVGHEAESVIAALGDRKFQSVHVDPNAEMIESVKAGLALARELDAAAGVLLHPADHPDVKRETLDELVRAAAASPRSAIMPTCCSKGGHPVLIPAELVWNIAAYRGSGGLRQFWLDHADRCVRLPVEDPGVTRDIDTPADYEARKPSAP